MEVTIFNDTFHDFKVKDGPVYPELLTEVYPSLLVGKIHPVSQNRSAFTYEFRNDQFVNECKYWNLFLHKDDTSLEAELVIPAEDIEDAREIRVYETRRNEIRHWISKPRDLSKELRRAPRRDFSDSELGPPVTRTPAVELSGFITPYDLLSFEAVKKDTSKRLIMVHVHIQFHMNKLLKGVKICHAQCEHLVQTYSKSILEMTETYFQLVSRDPSHTWGLYESKKLRLLISSLDSLTCSVNAANDLLRACGDENKWKRMALVISMPLSKEETYSRFAVLIHKLSWALDVIQYASSLKDLKFEWSEQRRRYVLKREYETDVSVAEVEAQADGVDERLVRDRTHLLSQLERGAIITPQNDSPSSAVQKLSILDDFAAVVKKRLQEIPDSRRPGSVPTCFQINHSHLQRRICIAGGTFKNIYKGMWFGQSVAISIQERTTRDEVEKEAGFMLEVQHLNVVDFYGCAFEEIKDEENASEDPESNPVGTGYFVMELMQQDLQELIEREVKKHGGAPFSLSVSVDILLQIVEAMFHMQKHNVLYRDLKAKNRLVSVRPKFNAEDRDVYSIKLIDFGTSKILDSEDGETATLNLGSSRWMSPEVMGIEPRKSTANPWFVAWNPFKFLAHEPVVTKRDGPKRLYNRSADVYSFAMTCYEIMTGLLPFNDVQGWEVRTKVSKGERPLFSDPAAITCPQRLQDLMERCWKQEPTARPEFKDIQRDLWKIKYDIEVPR